MLQSGYSYCNSTSNRKPSLKVKSVRFSPGWTSPSTVQTSTLFLFFLGHDLGFRSQEDLLDLRHRIIPVKSEGRRNVIHGPARAAAETNNATDTAKKKRTLPALGLISRKELEAHFKGRAE